MNMGLPLSIGIFNWRDVIEILCFATILYFFSLWLKYDTHKNLLPYFYGFCAFFVCAHFLALTTLSQQLFIFTPVILVIFILMHQTTLQRNLIALKNITYALPASPDWITTVMRTSLRLLHDNKEMLLLIEYSDALTPHVHTEYTINAACTPDLFSALVHNVYKPRAMLWINAEGIIRGVNASWKTSWYPQAYENHYAWIDDAIAHTSTNDALVLHINPFEQQMTIVTQGILYQGVTVDHALQLIRKNIAHAHSVIEKGYPYDLTGKKTNMAQHLS
jgi:hypothetical protein